MTGLNPEMTRRLKDLLMANRPPQEIEKAMAAVNVGAAEGSKDQTISKECIIGHLSPTGWGFAVPHGIPESDEYVPGFIRRHFLAMNIKGFKLKIGEDGKTLLPPAFVQMAWKTQGRGRTLMIGTVYEMRIATPVTELPLSDEANLWKL